MSFVRVCESLIVMWCMFVGGVCRNLLFRMKWWLVMVLEVDLLVEVEGMGDVFGN